MTMVAVIQMVSCGAVGPNLVEAKRQIQYAVDQGARLVVLPESFALWPTAYADISCVAENIGAGRIQDWLARIAEEYGIWLVAGSIALNVPDKESMTNTCLVYDDKGHLQGRYDQSNLQSGYTTLFFEEAVEPVCLSEPEVVLETPFGKLGLALGFDLYSPMHFIKLREKGAQIVAIASAFALAPGKAHFKPLVQARAIENQFYVLASDQGGLHDNGVETYGGSRIVGPWGLVHDTVRMGPSVAKADIDLLRIDVLRDEFKLD